MAAYFADLSLAVDGVLFGVFFNGGQSCEAGTRCFIPEHLHEEFLERLVQRANSLRVGDPLDMETDIGPLVSGRSAARSRSISRIGKREGALLACGGERRRTRLRARPFPPADDLHPRVKQHAPGPGGDLRACPGGHPYTSVTEAVEQANASAYGLGASVWSRDLQVAIEVAKRIRSGTVWINDHHLINPLAPFGGYKQSGVGREHGLQGLLEYTEAKHIHVDLMQKREGRLWWDTLLPPDGE